MADDGEFSAASTSTSPAPPTAGSPGTGLSVKTLRSYYGLGLPVRADVDVYRNKPGSRFACHRLPGCLVSVTRATG
jgi:hypothetical protein